MHTSTACPRAQARLPEKKGGLQKWLVSRGNVALSMRFLVVLRTDDAPKGCGPTPRNSLIEDLLGLLTEWGYDEAMTW